MLAYLIQLIQMHYYELSFEVGREELKTIFSQLHLNCTIH